MPLPSGINERRQDCIDHEARLDKATAEIHRFGGYFAMIGGGITIGFAVIGWFGSSINGKLDGIETLLSADKVAIAELKQQHEAVKARIDNIERRHEYLDQNGKRK